MAEQTAVVDNVVLPVADIVGRVGGQYMVVLRQLVEVYEGE